MNKKELELIALLANPSGIPLESKAEVAKYLNNVAKNPNGYNKKASAALKKSAKLSDAQRVGLQNLRNLSHKMRTLDSAYDLIGRAERVWAKAKAGEVVEPHDRLTLAELRMLKDVAGLTIVQPFLDAGIDPNGAFGKAIKLAKPANTILAELDERLELQSGDIGFYNLDREAALRGKGLDMQERVMRRMSPYGHAVQVLFDEKGKPYISHLGEEVRTDTFSIVGRSYTTFFRVDPVKLMDPEAQSRLSYQQKDQVRVKFQELLKKEHEQAKSLGLTNPTSGQVQAVAAHLIGRHTRRDSMSAPMQDSKGMLCSQFVATTTVKALVALEQWMITEYGIAQGSMRQLIGPSERMGALLPARLVQLLEASSACTVVPLPETLQRFMQAEDPKSQARFHKAQTELGKDKIALLLADKDSVVEKLRALDLNEVDGKKRDEVIAYMDKLVKEKQWPILSAITNKFKKIFGVATTKERLNKLVMQACREVTEITTASIGAMRAAREQEIRKRYLGSKVTPPAVSTVQAEELTAGKVKTSEGVLQEHAQVLARLRGQFEAGRKTLAEKQNIPKREAEAKRKEEARAKREMQSARSREGQRRAMRRGASKVR